MSQLSINGGYQASAPPSSLVLPSMSEVQREAGSLLAVQGPGLGAELWAGSFTGTSGTAAATSLLFTDTRREEHLTLGQNKHGSVWQHICYYGEARQPTDPFKVTNQCFTSVSHAIVEAFAADSYLVVQLAQPSRPSLWILLKRNNSKRSTQNKTLHTHATLGKTHSGLNAPNASIYSPSCQHGTKWMQQQTEIPPSRCQISLFIQAGPESLNNVLCQRKQVGKRRVTFLLLLVGRCCRRWRGCSGWRGCRSC